MDLQLILDAGKVIDYMSKYVTKTETKMTRSIANLVRNILKQTIEDGMNVQAALKKTMSKLLGERIMSK